MNVIYSGYFVDDVDSLKKLFPNMPITFTITKHHLPSKDI